MRISGGAFARHRTVLGLGAPRGEICPNVEEQTHSLETAHECLINVDRMSTECRPDIEYTVGTCWSNADVDVTAMTLVDHWRGFCPQLRGRRPPKRLQTDPPQSTGNRGKPDPCRPHGAPRSAPNRPQTLPPDRAANRPLVDPRRRPTPPQAAPNRPRIGPRPSPDSSAIGLALRP